MRGPHRRMAGRGGSSLACGGPVHTHTVSCARPPVLKLGGVLQGGCSAIMRTSIKSLSSAAPRAARLNLPCKIYHNEATHTHARILQLGKPVPKPAASSPLEEQRSGPRMTPHLRRSKALLWVACRPRRVHFKERPRRRSLQNRGGYRTNLAACAHSAGWITLSQAGRHR